MLNNLPNGITFDGQHTYYDFGLWLSERPDLGVPEAKTNQIEVPGSDGIIDLTEANAGEVKFYNREIKFTFAAMVNVDRQEEFKAKIRNSLHGKMIKKIILDEDPDWYYTGRCSVEFVDIKPWKLRCVVVVDAAPYAMKNVETVVDLDPDNMNYEEQSVERAVNDSQQDWNSNFMLGTKEFPAGIWSPGYQQFLITWPQTATRATYTPFVNVVDADGHAYTANIQTPFDEGEVNVSFDSLTQAGVATGRVYRILVSGIGDCQLFTQFLAGHVRVWNERKTVMPVFNLAANYDVALTINGRNYTIPLGTSQVPEITLRQGWNDIYMPLDTEANITKFTMTFREGKL